MFGAKRAFTLDGWLEEKVEKVTLPKANRFPRDVLILHFVDTRRLFFFLCGCIVGLDWIRGVGRPGFLLSFLFRSFKNIPSI